MDSYAIKYDGGVFGRETVAAVKHIQKYLRMPCNGVYDVQVRAQLLKMLEAAATA